MDMQEYINNQIKAQRALVLAASDQLTLGELIAKIEPIAEKQKQRITDGREEAQVYFDFEYLHPTRLISWRGSYAELSLCYSTEGDAMPVSKFLEKLKEAVGKTFYGYKGGNFQMSRQTPIWVANYGNAGNTAVIGVLDLDYNVIIQTGYREF